MQNVKTVAIILRFGKQSTSGGLQWTVFSRQSTVFQPSPKLRAARQSAVDSPQSAVASPQYSVGSSLSTIFSWRLETDLKATGCGYGKQ